MQNDGMIQSMNTPRSQQHFFSKKVNRQKLQEVPVYLGGARYGLEKNRSGFNILNAHKDKYRTQIQRNIQSAMPGNKGRFSSKIRKQSTQKRESMISGITNLIPLTDVLGKETLSDSEKDQQWKVNYLLEMKERDPESYRKAVEELQSVVNH